MKNKKRAPALIGDLKSRLLWLMFFRIIIATFFLAIAAFSHLQKSDSYLAPHLLHIYVLIGAVYSLTFIYVSVLHLTKNYKNFAWVQILTDVILITALVFITGGVSSGFSFMYSISIIAASILLYFKGGVFAATLSALSYSALIICQHYNLIIPFQSSFFSATGYSGDPLYLPIIVNTSTFYIVAFLSSFLAEQGKKSRLQLQEKQVDVENLEAFNENIIQSINSGLITLDNEEKIITFNRAAREITGLLLPDVYLKHVKDIFQGMILPECNDMQDDQLAATRFEITFKKNEDRDLFLGFSLSDLKDKKQQKIGTILVFQDLTDFREMQDYIQRMDRLAAIGRLAAGIAHEVRNPLASISGSIQVLKKSLHLKETDERLMDIIVRESSNLSELISEFTQFAKPGKKKSEQFKLKFLVDEVVDIFKNSPECSAPVRISQNIRDDIYIKANYQQLKQVIWNLVINASQAINNSAGEISLSAEVKKGGHPVVSADNDQSKDRFDPNLSFVEIVVHDTGCGIDRKHIDKIFDPFFTTRDRGTGLGLSVVYKIIQDHNGTISGSSSSGQGTDFTIHLPL